MRHFFLTSLLLLSTHLPASDTLTGSVMCGYQGWFSTPADGSGLGWRHYGFEKPGQCHIDLWPDVSELDADEKVPTPLLFADGSPAHVFSSANAKTTRRHFDWMQQHGIDGVFLQRFGSVLRDPRSRAHADTVLENVQKAAEATGRTFCIMYDLSGMRAGEIDSIVMQDWKRLRREKRVLESPAYQKHAKKPVVAVWGIGFGDDRAYSLDECHALLRLLHDNPEWGGLTVMAGVPWGWRTLDRDAAPDARLHQVLGKADIISPWAVGRYHDEKSASHMITSIHTADAAWCQARGKDYLPVIFPGFSWANLMKMRGKEAKLDQVPRHGGRFLWHQAQQRMQLGSRMLYVAMFDELDEGTAIFKTASTVPVGTVGFVTEPTLPSDHYLWLTGQIGRILRGEMPLPDAMPERKL
ncbi:MAG: xylosidase/arabinosidase [Verrucomicrobiaceae bacterium]|nr:xylosidase/arabinosidase [Verrucomicrobiaceae bacterium]